MTCEIEVALNTDICMCKLIVGLNGNIKFTEMQFEILANKSFSRLNCYN